MKRITWGEKVDMILMYPYVTIRQIQSLLTVGQPAAIILREKTLELAKKEGRYTGKGVPTDLLLKVAGLDIDYFHNMAVTESVARSGKRI